MKNFKMNIVLKPLLSMALIVQMVLPTNAFASTITKEQVITNPTSITVKGHAITDPTTLELIKTFPSFKTSLDADTNGELVSSRETYIKYTPKSNVDIKKIYNNSTDVAKDFEITEYTKQQYETEEAQSSLNSSIGLFSTIGDQTETPCSWLAVNFQVYNGSTAGTFMAYNFSSWKAKPNFRFEDGIGISCGTGITVVQDNATRHASYNHNVFPNKDYTQTLQVTINAGQGVSNVGNGVLATFNLGDNNTLTSYPTYDNIMISSGFQFTGSGTSNGWLSANYLHKQIGIGSINMDAAGVPSVSFSISHDEHQALIYIAK
jgi:hypothetical protein